MNTQTKLAILMGLVNVSFLGKALLIRPVVITSLVALIVFDLSMSDLVSGTKSKRSYLLAAIAVPISLLLILLF